MTLNHRSLKLPDGIDDDTVAASRRTSTLPHTSSLVVLGLLVALGVSGYAGGKRHHRDTHTETGNFSVDMPAILRTGDVLETRLRVVADTRIDKLVVGIEPALWRQMTINSTVPTAADERFEDGLVRYTFGAVDAGRAFEWQVAQQINPSRQGVNRGAIVFFDGARQLASFSIDLWVLP